MRVRVGVGNRILFNHLQYLVGPKSFWIYVFARGFCTLDSPSSTSDADADVMPTISVGSGRARSLHRALLRSRHRPRDAGLVPRETSIASGSPSSRRRVAASRTTALTKLKRRTRVPLDDGSVDFVLLTSLFTHLLEDDLVNYVRETRLLRSGRPHDPVLSSPSRIRLETVGGRHTFFGYRRRRPRRVAPPARGRRRLFGAVHRGRLWSAGLSDVSFLPASWQVYAVAKKG